MSELTNPFDILPANLFNILSTQGQGDWQRHYLGVLLRIYELAEFNRFGLTREQVLAAIVDYLHQQGDDVLNSVADQASLAGERVPNEAHEYASWLIRRLDEAGWIEREQQADYTEYIILPDYAFTLLEAFRTIQQQKPREYTGQLYTAHQLLTRQGDDFSPALAVTQAYENIRQALRGLNELNQNIRRYTERVTRDRSVAELLRLQYEDYVQVLGSAYHTLKTSDHVSRYRRDIVNQLQQWELDDAWLNRTADELAGQGHFTPAQAVDEISHYLRFITMQLESLDPLLEEIDRRHAQYLRTSLRQIRYQLVSADGSFKDRLTALARQLAALQEENEDWLPDDSPAFQTTPVEHPDHRSFYTPPTKRAPFTPQPVVAPTLDPATIRHLHAATLQDIGSTITPAKIQHFVNQFFNLTSGQVIAIDGKRLRRSHDGRLGKAAIHMVSAWASANRLVLGQVKTNEKSNEITAIPELLKLLVIKDCIVTIDAMGCQTDIARLIIDQGGDYVLALKGNQGTLHRDVQDLLAYAQEIDFKEVAHDHHQTIEKDHGRLEIRSHWTISDPELITFVDPTGKWTGLQSIGMVEAQRTSGDQTSAEVRYFISSLPGDAAQFAQAVRSH